MAVLGFTEIVELIARVLWSTRITYLVLLSTESDSERKRIRRVETQRLLQEREQNLPGPRILMTFSSNQC
ncbi:hypothetical protein BWQ96_04719 [Gracilariopsis chorda]|uniref:Uncharacterized protein n=1 Tax=Gracilariopsis chorda TaxID=448386 RepID=A0A2V3IUZ3_9FLOR|nr:hypothetical protein BWQ96_04719 [Gracilariopsis chorda]|eukprot:PXF45517.1 hypothetical protein BWQ96_04719 [Gracilariopsis chorda]